MVRGHASLVHIKLKASVLDAVFPSRGLMRSTQDPRTMSKPIVGGLYELCEIGVVFCIAASSS
jgi:hypothetical protein